MQQQPEPIYCHSTHKLLAKHDQNGIWLWCKECKEDHYFLWKDIEPEDILRSYGTRDGRADELRTSGK